MFLLGGTLALNELHIDSGEQRQLNKHLIEGVSESSVPYIVGFAEFLTNTIPIISSSFELLFDRYRKIPITTRSVDVVPIGHRNNVINRNTNNVILQIQSHLIYHHLVTWTMIMVRMMSSGRV